MPKPMISKIEGGGEGYPRYGYGTDRGTRQADESCEPEDLFCRVIHCDFARSFFSRFTSTREPFAPAAAAALPMPST